VRLTQASKLEEVGFLIRDVKNSDSVPPSENLIIRILDSTGALIDSTESAGSSPFVVAIIPDQLESASIENENKIVGQYG
jgi:hypothetical protein